MAVPRCAWGRSRRTPVPTPHSEGQPPRLATPAVGPLRHLSWLARIYVFVFRGTPLLVQIFLIYYGLGQFRPALQELGLWSFVREPYWTGHSDDGVARDVHGDLEALGRAVDEPPLQVILGRESDRVQGDI